MKKWIFLSLLSGMLFVGGVFGVTTTGWADAERRLTMPAGLFEGSSNFELRYETGSLDPASLNGSALGVDLFDSGNARYGALQYASLLVKSLKVKDGKI